MKDHFTRTDRVVAVAEKSAGREVIVDDASLVTGAKSGDVEILGVLYSRYIRPVFAFAFTQVGNRVDAEDVSQETFLAFWESRHRIELSGDSILPWLLATARFKSLNLRRARARVTRVTTSLDESIPSPAKSPAEQVEADQMSKYLEGVLESLSVADRRLFEMCIIDKISYAKAAGSLGLTHQTVRGRLARLRSRLRRELQPVKGES